MKALHGKHALITGAASGIGRCLAVELAKHGCHLSLWDVDAEGLGDVVEHAVSLGVRAEPVYCDLSQPAQITQSVRSFLNRWTTLDLLINNAGVAFYGPTERMTDEQWDWLLQINLRAPIQLTRELLPTLIAQREAHVVNTCSIAGLVAARGLAAYHVSKFGLVGFTESMRAEHARRGVGFTALCPGLVRTPMLRSALNGRRGKPIKQPPRWLCVSPEKVARKAVAAIRRNRGLVVVSAWARVLWLLKRLAPGVLDLANRLRRKRSDAKDSQLSSNKREAA